MTRWRTCYVCGGYSRGARHRTCTPSWTRRQFRSCAVCGGKTRGEMHRRCRYPNATRLCEYCREPFAHRFRARYHNGCQPSKPELAIFADLPTIVQRRCGTCREWFPFASITPTDETVGAEYWPRGGDRRGATFKNVCRSCDAERRRRSEQRERRVAA